MIGNDWEEKLNIIWNSEGFKKISYNFCKNKHHEGICLKCFD